MRIYVTKAMPCEAFDSLMLTLQTTQPEDSFFSPLHNFGFLDEINTEACLDWLNESERLIVVGQINERMREEIALAKLCKMEVEYIEIE